MALTKVQQSLSSTPSISDSGTSTALTIDSSGNVSISGNLTVTGSTTTADNLNSADKNITLNYHASNDTSGSADGAGITIQDAVDASTNASLYWRASDDKFIFSHPLRMFGQFELPDNVKLVAGDGNDLQIYHDGSHSYVKDNAQGNLILQGSNLRLAETDNTLYAFFTSGAGGEFYYDGSKKFETTSAGANVTGTLEVDNLTINTAQGSDGQVLTSTGSGVGWETPSSFNADAAQIFNDSGNAVDFRIESDNNANMFFVDGSADRIGIGYGSPASPLDIRTAHTSTDLTAANTNSTITIGNTGSGDGVYNSIKFAGNQQDMYMMSINHGTQASRRIGLFVGSVAGDATTDERLSVLGNGYVGIGTSAPASLLHLKSTAASASSPTIIFENTNNAQTMNIDYYNNAGAVQSRISYDEGPAAFSFRPNVNSTSVYMAYDGKVGIGETSPLGKLHIKEDDSGQGSVNSNFDQLVLEDDSHSGMTILSGTSGDGGIYFGDSGANNRGQFKYRHSNDSFGFITADGSDYALILESSDNALFAGDVGIGSSPNMSKLGLSGGSGALLSLAGDDSQIRMANQVIHADNSGFTTFYLRNNYGQTSASAAMRLQTGYFQVESGTSYTKRYTIHGNGKHEFWGTHQGDSVGHFVFSNGVGTDGTSTNCTLMVKNGNAQVQIMPWSTLGARVGTRGGGWNSNSNNACYLTSNDASNIILNTNGSPTLGNGTAISSDERLKKNITDIADGQLAKVNALKPRNFEWKDERKAGNQEGFIAQEVETVMPEAVEERIYSPDPDDTSRDFEGDIKVLKHEVINARLIKAVQELSAKLEAAEARITTLEG